MGRLVNSCAGRQMWRAARTYLGGACVALLAACVDDERSAEGACEDYAHVFAAQVAECGYDYDDNLDAILESLGGCDRFEMIRNVDELYSVCLPSIESLECSQIEDPNLQLDDSCRSQFVPKATSSKRESRKDARYDLRFEAHESSAQAILEGSARLE